MQVNLIGRVPPEQEFAGLTDIRFEKKPISAVERKRKMGQGFMLLLAGIACAGILAFCYFVLDTILISIFLGLAIPLCLVGSIVCFAGIFRNPMAKTPQDALKKFAEDVLIGGDDTNVDDFKNKRTDYTYEVLNRVIPSKLMPGKTAFVQYLMPLRTMCLEFIESSYQATFNKAAKNDYHGVQSIEPNVISVETLAAGIERHTVQYNLTYQSTNKDVVFAQICFNVTAILIQAGQYWYVYDTMPEYNDVREAKEVAV
jgi:hypothetical protein